MSTKKLTLPMEEVKTGNSQKIERPVKRRQSGIETRERMLSTSTRLFAEHGYGGLSVRQICSEAGVNLALMSYHFGTKERLLQEIFERGTNFINAERTRLINECEVKFAKSAPVLEDLLFAFVSPTLRAIDAGDEDDFHFLRLSGRLATDPTPEVRRVMANVYDTVALRFVRLLKEACPHLSMEEFFWRLIFFYGAMLYTRADTGRVLSLSTKLDLDFDATDGEKACRNIIPFLAAGFRAPPAFPAKPPHKKKKTSATST
jgi:AcrR family transcriptional regulator